MFSGDVTIMTSIPPFDKRSRDRATRPSYSLRAKADSLPWRTPSLVCISKLPDEMALCGVKTDAEARLAAGAHLAVGVDDASNRIVGEAVGTVEFGEGRPRGAGDV